MDAALKQRLLGASILIALAVIFIPMLFDEPVKTGEVTSDIAIPPAPPAPEMQTRTFAAHPEAENTAAAGTSDTGAVVQQNGAAPVIDTSAIPPLVPLYPPPETEAPGGGDAAVESAATESVAGESLAPGSAAPVTAEAAVSTPRAATAGSTEQTVQAPAATAPPEAGGGPWQVQAASFASSNNAERLASQLEELGYRTSIDTVYRAEQPLHRVRAVGFADERAAAAAAQRIAGDLPRLRPRVVAPEGETRTTASAGVPVQRYAVQLGVFSTADNATRLLEKVRAADFAAFVEQQQRPEGLVQVVKVGPLLSRDDALDVRRRLSKTLAIDGLIVEYH